RPPLPGRVGGLPGPAAPEGVRRMSVVAPGFPARARRTRRACAAALAALLVVAAPLAVDGLAATASATPCRTQVVGDDLPANTGPYPLIDQLGLRQAW